MQLPVDSTENESFNKTLFTCLVVGMSCKMDNIVSHPQRNLPDFIQ